MSPEPNHSPPPDLASPAGVCSTSPSQLADGTSESPRPIADQDSTSRESLLQTAPILSGPENGTQQPLPDASDNSEIPDQNTSKNSRAPRRASSKIGRLPKATRDKLNFLLRDGKSYPDTLATLGEDAKDITARNVSSWHTSPAYQHWLLEQEWLEDLRDRQESACDLLNDFDAAKFNQAVLQLAVSRLFLSFRHLEDGDLNTNLGGNARAFANLVHALARACRETTNIEKYREACAKAVATELKQLNVDRDLSDREYELLVNKMDKIFKVARRPAAPKPNETGPQTVPLPLENNNHVP